MILVVLENGFPRMIKLSDREEEIYDKEGMGDNDDFFYYLHYKYGFSAKMDWMIYDDFDCRVIDGNRVEYESYESYLKSVRGDDYKEGEVSLWDEED